MPHAHLVATDSANSELSIFRLHEDGKKVLLTSIAFDAIRTMGLSRFSVLLGENIVLDNETLRNVFEGRTTDR